MPPSDTAAVVIIGDEILSGRFAEENAVYLIKALHELGTALRRIEIVPDALEEISDAVRRCSERYHHVLTSGGVGPTHDDITIGAIAHAFGVPVVRSPKLEQHIRSFFGDHLEERNLRMAEIPEGASLIDTTGSAWPVLCYRNVYILPGVPAIFRRKFEMIRERFRTRPFHLRRIYCAADEATIAHHLDQVVADCPAVSIGSYPRNDSSEYRVIVTLESRDHEAVAAAETALLGRLATEVVRVE
ncbi:MAG: molybdopterin-binding protein [Pseudomonadota bacterium]